jgi:hypothetical protein
LYGFGEASAVSVTCIPCLDLDDVCAERTQQKRPILAGIHEVREELAILRAKPLHGSAPTADAVATSATAWRSPKPPFRATISRPTAPRQIHRPPTTPQLSHAI